MLSIHTAFSQVLSKYVFLQSTHTQSFLLKCTCYNLCFYTFCLADSPQKHQHQSAEMFVRVVPQLSQARYARQQGKFFVTLVCLPRFCSRELFMRLWLFSTLQVNTAMLATSSTAVEHAKCCKVTVSHVQSQNQFTPRLVEDVIPSCHVLGSIL